MWTVRVHVTHLKIIHTPLPVVRCLVWHIARTRTNEFQSEEKNNQQLHSGTFVSELQKSIRFSARPSTTTTGQISGKYLTFPHTINSGKTMIFWLDAGEHTSKTSRAQLYAKLFRAPETNFGSNVRSPCKFPSLSSFYLCPRLLCTPVWVRALVWV